jgi:hypothetical protein
MQPNPPGAGAIAQQPGELTLGCPQRRIAHVVDETDLDRLAMI